MHTSISRPLLLYHHSWVLRHIPYCLIEISPYFYCTQSDLQCKRQISVKKSRRTEWKRIHVRIGLLILPLGRKLGVGEDKCRWCFTAWQCWKRSQERRNTWVINTTLLLPGSLLNEVYWDLMRFHVIQFRGYGYWLLQLSDLPSFNLLFSIWSFIIPCPFSLSKVNGCANWNVFARKVDHKTEIY